MLAAIVAFAARAAVSLTNLPAILFTLAICFPASFKTRACWVLVATAVCSPPAYNAQMGVATHLNFQPESLVEVTIRTLASFTAWGLLVTAIRWLLTSLLHRK